MGERQILPPAEAVRTAAEYFVLYDKTPSLLPEMLSY